MQLITPTDYTGGGYDELSMKVKETEQWDEHVQTRPTLFGCRAIIMPWIAVLAKSSLTFYLIPELKFNANHKVVQVSVKSNKITYCIVELPF